MDSLARLFGSLARVKLLRLFMFNRTETLSLADIAKRAKLSREITRAELQKLFHTGLIERRGKGHRASYRVNQRYSHLEALAAFVRSTTSISPANLLRLLKKAGNLRLVVLSGVFTGTIESGVDLLIVGDRLHERALRAAVYAIEAELGRELRYASFTTDDFNYRLGIYDRLIRDIFDYPHQAILDRTRA
ncbi:hypothetical protein A3E65_02085 [Candidatus Kaiserbacteria bacterium RIFCSPHIGHO2_12_FULL_56_13]|uniref:HTH arsR-type domain-containing protein n=2 Tax=Candidatus Kaiseribacteriota TaxID=1752734 RepID=A0A1F6E2E8_9BACT|nr:MAG: hypothetical protein A3C95_01145 [Candidatus Kaiserbacteria bacterium RIFCSPHIGHO2_02_FULL_56_30]OGG72259.1 MAG: hypothetical protein A3E65_02085 [Candidatus Kaiserbacteria bacterium RIFCSPHIGHO2_12_FULL_56_13]